MTASHRLEEAIADADLMVAIGEAVAECAVDLEATAVPSVVVTGALGADSGEAKEETSVAEAMVIGEEERAAVADEDVVFMKRVVCLHHETSGLPH